MNPPKCQECEKQGLTPDRIDYIGSSATLLGGSTFWDKDGQEHYHNPNSYTHSYKCSNGHVWSDKEQKPCPACGDSWRQTAPRIPSPRAPGEISVEEVKTRKFDLVVKNE